MSTAALAALTTVVQLGLLLLLAVIAGLALREARDAHARGIARVMRGTSWSRKGRRP